MNSAVELRKVLNQVDITWEEERPGGLVMLAEYVRDKRPNLFAWSMKIIKIRSQAEHIMERYQGT